MFNKMYIKVNLAIFSAVFLSLLLYHPINAENKPVNKEITSSNMLANPVEEVKIKDYGYLTGKLHGISDSQLKQHFQLYQGYVKRLNQINNKLKAYYEGKEVTYPEYRALLIERSYENNGVILHELYFDNLTSKEATPSKEFKQYIIRDFGSYEAYIKDLKAAASVSRGWVVTAINKREGKLRNYIFDLHNDKVSAGIKPVLIMDLYEHAYMVDYGIDRNSYIEAFLKNVDWNKVSERLMDKN